jgi:hypothetical protein
MKKGIYRDGKVIYLEPMVHALSGGNWETGWSGTKSFGGGLKTVDVQNINDWWPTPNQEVKFRLEEGKAIIVSLGEKKTNDYVERYYLSTL